MARRVGPTSDPKKQDEIPTARELEAGGEVDELSPPGSPSPPVPEAEQPTRVERRPASLAPDPLPPPDPPSERNALAEARESAEKVRMGLYRVWEHGTLQRDGVTYKPGDTLELPEDVAAKIPCLVPV